MTQTVPQPATGGAAAFDLSPLFQICSQLSERLEKQQAASRGELEKIRVKATPTPAFLTELQSSQRSSWQRA